jgi:hypothetical protein
MAVAVFEQKREEKTERKKGRRDSRAVCLLSFISSSFTVGSG